MKRFLIVLSVIALIVCSLTVYADNSENSIMGKENTTFEGVTDVKATKWFKLIDAYGDSKGASGNYESIKIKTDGGHSGKNYLSMTADKSWYSPAINCYPFFKEAGEGTYIVSFYFRCSVSSYNPRKAILFRGLEGDCMEDSDYNPYIKPQSGNNYYASINGTIGAPDEKGWMCFVSEPFDVMEDEFDGDHNWWFCVDNLPNESFTYDIDDFVIALEDEFEDPNYVPEEKNPTELTYLTQEVKSSVIPKVDANKAKKDTEKHANESDVTETAAPTVTASPTPEATTSEENGLSTGVTIIIALAALIICGGSAYCITNMIKGKYKK